MAINIKTATHINIKTEKSNAFLLPTTVSFLFANEVTKLAVIMEITRGINKNSSIFY